MASVYWIHLPEHFDVTSEGYIGVTKSTVDYRFAQHKAAANRGSSLKVHRAIKKYQDELIVDTLVNAEEIYCYELEAKLRDKPFVGWNIAIGGLKSPMSGRFKENSPCFGKPLSEDHRAKISLANSGTKNGMSGRTGELNPNYGKTATEKQLEANRDRGVAQMTFKNGWEHPYANPQSWQLALEFYSDFKTLKSFGRRSISSRYNLPVDSVIKIINKIKSGWNPNEDQEYLSWLDKKKGSI